MTEFVAFATALRLGYEYTDYRQHCHKNNQNLEGKVAGDANRGKFMVAKFANHNLGGDKHRVLGQIGCG